MSSKEKRFSLKGYMLSQSSIPSYYGVDRTPFLPSLIEDEFDVSVQPRPGSPIWAFYPPGWRQEAYRLYEQNLVDIGYDSFLLTNFKAAEDIQKIIEPQLGLYEIVEVEIFGPTDLASSELEMKPNFLGYDVAYLGGDFYSAVLGGLGRHYNNSQILFSEYKSYLNKFGLFKNYEILPKYIERYKDLVLSESASEFHIYAVRRVQIRRAIDGEQSDNGLTGRRDGL